MATPAAVDLSARNKLSSITLNLLAIILSRAGIGKGMKFLSKAMRCFFEAQARVFLGDFFLTHNNKNRTQL